MIIGLMGYAQSGKDSVAEILVNDFGYIRFAFADKVRELLYEMNPNFRDTLLQQAVDKYGWDEVKQDLAVRRMLQNLGVGARKIFGQNFWVNQVIDQFKLEYSKNIVITDVRFTNEANAIKEKNGELWRIKRPGVEAVNSHFSETELNEYKVDQTLNNGGNLNELKSLVHNRMDFLLANQIN